MRETLRLTAHTIGAVRNLAGLLLAQGKLEDAEPLFRRGLAGYAAALGERHPETINLMYGLAVVLDRKRVSLASRVFCNLLARCNGRSLAIPGQRNQGTSSDA